jgi:hypothetical protein
MILAWIDPDPRLFYMPGKSLLVLFSVAALLVSRLSPLQPRIREAILLALPPAVFICWLIAINLFPLHNDFSVKMETGICGAFGFAFSLDIWRFSDDPLRVYGRVSLVLYAIFLVVMHFWTSFGGS